MQPKLQRPATFPPKTIRNEEFAVDSLEKEPIPANILPKDAG
mgnify:FL=1|jgi:hypothetical protein